MSRVFYPQANHQYLLPLNCKDERNNMNSNHQHTNIATDEQLEQWWDYVKIVRCHAPFQEDAASAHDSSNGCNSNYPRSFLERCPMCLDEEMVSPCIAPCGHTFCLPCVLGYLNSVAKELNTESERVGKNKHEGKGGVVGASSKTAMNNRATVTSIRARCPMCSSGSSLVLHAGEAMLTYKDLRPVVFVPVVTIAASSAATIGESKKGSGGGGGGGRRKDLGHSLGTRMRFVKLHRAKHCPAPYLPLAGHRVRGGGAVTTATTASSMDAAEQHQQNLPDLPDGDDDCEECIYTRQYFVGVNEYENILQRDLDDLQNYREKSMYCQMDPREAWNVSMAIEAIQAAQRRWIGSSIDDGGFRRIELDVKVAAGIRKQSGQQLLLPEAADEGDDTNADGLAPSRRKGNTKTTCCLQPGSFPLHQNSESNTDESAEFLYYQSSDGQHCYLSGFDMVCLMHEFSLDQYPQKSTCTDATQSDQDDTLQFESRKSRPSRTTLPLPDEITATIVSVDQCTVTTSLIKRKPFLSHMPLHSSVSFVEIDWYSGGDKCNQPLLSQSTLSKFRGELQRRKSERQRLAKREKTADEIARAKSEKDERRRRQELLESNYYDGEVSRQTIDPGDDFFQAPAVSVDETDKPSQWNRTRTHQFSAARATEEMWPELK